MNAFVQKIAIFSVVLLLASACQKKPVEPAEEEATTTEATLPPPLTVDDIVAAASAANARTTSEMLLNKVSNRSISRNQWQDIFVMQNSTFDRNANYLARLYVYTSGAQVDLYASDFIGGGWRVLGQNTSNSFPQKEITFLLRFDTAETRIKVFGRTGTNVRFDLAIYKLNTPAVQRIAYSTSTTNQSTLSHGQIYGYIGGVAVYANGSNITFANGRNSVNGTDTGLRWQCVELVRRFMLIYYKKVMGADYNARDFYANAWRWGMTSYANGGGMAPRPGDILCFGAAASNGNFGHVEPIIEVGADYVLVARQNVWGDTHIGKRYARSGNRISAANVQGWIR